MLCKKCKTELPEESQFCNKCGTKIKTTSSPGKSKKIWFIISGIAGILLVVALVIWYVGNRPFHTYKNAIQDNKVAEANHIYGEKIKGDPAKELEVSEYLKSEIEEIKQNYISNKIDYTHAANQLENIQKTNLAKSEAGAALSTVRNLNNSRTAFKTGQELLNNNDLRASLKEFKRVIKTDEANYAKAQEIIQDASAQYKATVLESTQKLVAEQKYNDAIVILNEALTIMSDDSDLLAKKTAYQKKQQDKLDAERREKIQQLEKDQEVSVLRTSTFTDWLEQFHVSVVVKNNTDKVVKRFVVGWMGYDKNGYPVKTGWISPTFLREGEAEENIQPGSTFGADRGWKLTVGYDTTDAVTFIACVKEVQYYDGTTWTNEYYPIWVQEHLEKPLK